MLSLSFPWLYSKQNGFISLVAGFKYVFSLAKGMAKGKLSPETQQLANNYYQRLYERLQTMKPNDAQLHLYESKELNSTLIKGFADYLSTAVMSNGKLPLVLKESLSLENLLEICDLALITRLQKEHSDPQVIETLYARIRTRIHAARTAAKIETAAASK